MSEPTHADRVAYQRRTLLNAAVAYGQAKSFGRYLNQDGSWVTVNDAVDRMKDLLCKAAVDLVAEMTNAPHPEHTEPTP